MGRAAIQPAGFAGNLGRNTLILPGYAGVDMSLVKRFTVVRESTIEFRAEAFAPHMGFNRPEAGFCARVIRAQ